MTRAHAVACGRPLLAFLLALSAALALCAAVPAVSRADACTPPVTNPIACENTKVGADPNTWQIEGDGDNTIQGYPTRQSVNKGQTISFKIKSATSNYHIDILRLGYYGGDGARLMQGNITPTNTAAQPQCLTDSNTGLIDCGNWSVSYTWTVPSTAVSGVYIAHLVRNDTGGDSHIKFVVRDDTSNSSILLQTSDATWQAYNSYGGNSLYVCTVSCPPGNPAAYKAAYKVSYNRPLDTEQSNGQSAFFNGGEWPMVRFLEANGYNVSYAAQADVAGTPSLLLSHKVFMSSGHDEYWSASQRTNVENARDAGVNLAFFSGNEVFWKTRWESSSADGSSQPSRTLVAYKDTHFTAQQDPVSWTGTWMDPRFAAASDNVTPQNALTGQLFVVNSGTADIKVPNQFRSLRFWRGTAVASMTGTSSPITLGADTLGYEWDVDVDNGFRPAGQFQLSSTTASGLETFTDYGSTTIGTGTATHNMTMYRASSGALVFGAGTVQWSWGLDDANRLAHPPNRTMQQATVNLMADMGAQPSTIITGLSTTTASTDHTAPTATISSPPSSVSDGATVTLSGSASDTGGGVVAGVEVSTDGGSSWHPATGTTSWTYAWKAHGNPSATIKVRATDDSGNMQTPGAGVNVSVACPCSIWGTTFTPPNIVSDDTTATEVGVRFRSDTYGSITGVRFYKVAGNTGTHVGSLWAADGTRLAQATFSSESASGWQTVTFPTPVSVLPNTTYVASYHAPNGHYAATGDYLYSWPGMGQPTPQLDAAPLHVVRNAGSTGNGVYAYSGTSTFPANSYNAGNYWVDVAYQPIQPAGQPTGVTATAGRASASVSWTAPASGGAPTSYEVTPYIGSSAQTAKTITGTPPATSTTMTGLTAGTTYTFKVRACNPNGCGTVSSDSNAVTVLAPAAPAPPTGVAAEAASQKVRVSWTAPSSDNGSPITGYTVTPYIGTTAQTPVPVSASATSTTVTGLANGTAYTFRVTATNAIGSTDSAASGAATPENMLFDLATPTTVDGLDASPVELGMKFKADQFGVVTGVRFYKAPTNTGTHVGSLWTTGGTLLARATFTGESASGWQTAQFDTPVAVSAGTTYVVSYFAPNGHYSVTAGDFNSAVDNPPLHAIANGASANGLYAYTGGPTFPPNSYGSSNYWVDVTFTPTPSPGQVTGVTATAGRASATVSWTTPSTGGPPTSYEVTPYIGSTAQTTKTVTGTPLPTSTTIGGLTAGTAYTFRVRAVNPNGAGTSSAASNAVTPQPAIAPAAPTDLFAAPASASAHVSWSAPDDGGSAITGYTVTPFLDGAAQTGVPVSAANTSVTINGLTNGGNYTFKVTATNAVGSTQSPASATVVPESTLLDFATPSTIDSGDGSGVELGMKFKSDVKAKVTGIRFHKAAANTGTHVGSLWTTGGTLLARATFTAESASGWQAATFSTPVDITAGTTYVASYLAPNGHYSVTTSGFATALDNPPLHGILNSASPNGLYAYTGAPSFPSNSYAASNYYVDVLVDPTPVPGQVTGVTATADTAAANVSWTAPSGSGAPTSYEVIPYIGATAQTTRTVSGSPLPTSTRITGLTPGTSYTFKVRGVNENGNGALSAASNAVTPLAQTAPSAPTSVAARPATRSALVDWNAPSSDGGSAITGYTVTPYLGATAQTPVPVGVSSTSTTVTGLTNGTSYTFRVTATNATGSTQSTASAAVTPAQTLFDFATPSTTDSGDSDGVEVGVKFKSDVDGQVTGIRFYKAAANTGTHVGTLWTAGGSQLARATFTGESSSGWQTVTFASPVSVTAGTTYVASYHAPNGHYSVTGGAFGTIVDSGPLHTIANATSPNGVYGYSATPTMPNNDFNAANYWVDVMFLPAGGS